MAFGVKVYEGFISKLYISGVYKETAGSVVLCVGICWHIYIYIYDFGVHLEYNMKCYILVWIIPL